MWILFQETLQPSRVLGNIAGILSLRNFDFKTSLVKWRCWFYFHWSVGHPHSSGYKILYSPIKFLETWLAYGLVNFRLLRLRGDFSVSVNRLRLSTTLWIIYSLAGKIGLGWSTQITARPRGLGKLWRGSVWNESWKLGISKSHLVIDSTPKEYYCMIYQIYTVQYEAFGA